MIVLCYIYVLIVLFECVVSVCVRCYVCMCMMLKVYPLLCCVVFVMYVEL